MKPTKEGFVKMLVGGLTLDPVTKTPIVVLKDDADNLNLPIWIGLLEATSMATELEGVKMARPMTHDLLKTMVERFGAEVESIEVTALKENTFYALINLAIDDTTLSLDSRPSDAISLALRTGSPIYVAKEVLEASSVLSENSQEEGEGIIDEAEEGEEAAAPDVNLSEVAPEDRLTILEQMDPDDFKYKM